MLADVLSTVNNIQSQNAKAKWQKIRN
jgi:hypothetical protein